MCTLNIYIYRQQAEYTHIHTHNQAHLHGGAAGGRGLAALGAAHAGGIESNGDSLLGDVQLEAVPAQHVLAHGRHLAGTLQEGQVLLGPTGGSRGGGKQGQAEGLAADLDTMRWHAAIQWRAAQQGTLIG